VVASQIILGEVETGRCERAVRPTGNEPAFQIRIGRADPVSALSLAEVPHQGEDQEMLVRDKAVVRAFEESAVGAGGTIVTVFKSGSQRVRYSWG
jgi:hypothetical protein